MAATIASGDKRRGIVLGESNERTTIYSATVKMVSLDGATGDHRARRQPLSQWVADLAMGKSGKEQEPNLQPPYLLQGCQSNFVQLSCGQKTKESFTFLLDPSMLGQLNRQRWHHNSHHITLSVLLPQRGRKVFSFKARECAAIALCLLMSLGVLLLALTTRQSGRSLCGA